MSNPFDCVRQLKDKVNESPMAYYEDLSDDQIVDHLAAVCVYIAAKYLELHYPMIEDIIIVFGLGQHPKQAFIEMEQRIYQMFDWDLQITTLPSALEHLFAQSVVFTTDVLRTQEGDK